MLCCRYLPVWINAEGRGVENKGKLKRQFKGQFYSLLVRKMVFEKSVLLGKPIMFDSPL